MTEETLKALNELIKSGIIGTMLVLVVAASAVGFIAWKPYIDDLKEQIKQLRSERDEGYKQRNEAIEMVTENTSAMKAMRETFQGLLAQVAHKGGR